VKLRAFGADLAVTYLNEKAEKHVRPLAEGAAAPTSSNRSTSQDARPARTRCSTASRSEWGGLDFLIHSIAFAPRADLHGRVVDCSAEGFAQAMHVSCWSFLRMAKLAEPLMTEGGALVTMSYYGADKVVGNYNMMGPVKAALEASVRYAANELGEKGIRVYRRLARVRSRPARPAASRSSTSWSQMATGARPRASPRRHRRGRARRLLPGGRALRAA
jgi:enoyl-[acyl-carrier protein] reductase I